MRLRAREREDEQAPPGDAGPQPQPEHEEPRLAEPTPAKLSKRDYLAILQRAVKEVSADNLTNIAAALAYYAFLAIPSVLMVAVGIFALVGDPSDAGRLVDRLDNILPQQAQELVRTSLANVTNNKGTGISVLVVGTLLALWTLTGAMQTLMWGLNVAYDRDETRGFVRKRFTALTMIGFAALGVLLIFGLLVLGPQITRWVGNAVGQETLVTWLWWTAQWPILIVGLLFAFAGMYFLGPNVEHPRWRFLTFGAGFGILVWLALSGLFAFYASRFGSYNKTWGALAAVVIMLTWLWLTALALLVGAEVNAEAERTRELRRGEPAEVELQAPAKA
ncbi:MAG TPA: YihY/virulence factor BrkB family protein [Gaiellaceae bacterium]|jgi:membrane protein